MGSTRACIAAAALLVTFAAWAEDAKPPAEIPVDRAAVSGRAQRIYLFYAVNPDCTMRGDIVIRVASAPAHGQARLEKGNDFPNYARDNPRFDCNKQEVPVQTLYYQSSVGYAGADSIVIEALYPDGHSYTTRFRIDVWPERSLENARTK